MQVRNHNKLNGWPPPFGAAYSKADTFPADPKLVSATMRCDHLEIRLTEGDHDCLGTISSSDKVFLDRFQAWLNENCGGLRLSEIGDLEIDF